MMRIDFHVFYLERVVVRSIGPIETFVCVAQFAPRLTPGERTSAALLKIFSDSRVNTLECFNEVYINTWRN